MISKAPQKKKEKKAHGREHLFYTWKVKFKPLTFFLLFANDKYIIRSSLYSSMVERNTVNILINVRFILKACILYRKHLMTILFKFKRISKAFWFNNNISDAAMRGGGIGY